MNGLTKPLAALAVSLVVMGGCGSSGKSSSYKPQEKQPVQEMALSPGDGPKLFPLKVGNRWVYEAEGVQTTPNGSNTSKSEVTFQIASIKDTADGKVVTIEVVSEGKITDRLNWRVSDKGIYQLTGSVRKTMEGPLTEVPYNPPVRIIGFPVKERESLKMAVTGIRPAATPGPLNMENSTRGVQEVDTAMGRMQALATETESSYQENNVKFRSSSTTYWAKDVGMVRFRQEVVAMNSDGRQISQTSVLRLKSYTQ
ncbi:MAG: hypothetical protein KIT11_10350 [Fimbriimonadaceae bacterium]|nr:hypothetical protein [Fimbriimonadaceae bacterium]QYK55722.1 MAG: hypothetical protein KF733_12020 [Fimbriimonadaceae bacterium]